MNTELYLKECRQHINQVLIHYLPKQTSEPLDLHNAMHYSLFNGGKRFRAALVYATGEMFGTAPEALDPVAAAIELIHAFTLVHDDLPAMDNDDLRRGKPTCHIAFNEAVAILVGDALQCLAFEILTTENNNFLPKQQLLMVKTLAHAIGSLGVAGGQAQDIAVTNQNISIRKLRNIYYHKTGDLISASMQLAAIASNIQDQNVLRYLNHAAKCMGLAFQIHDDIIDVQSSTDVLGKPQGSDIKKNKPTYPALVGIKKARNIEDTLYLKAIADLKKISTNTSLIESIFEYAIKRVH